MIEPERRDEYAVFRNDMRDQRRRSHIEGRVVYRRTLGRHTRVANVCDLLGGALLNRDIIASEGVRINRA
jgi:hypothetical protein